MATQNFYFYVLLCADNTLYAGYTVDLQARVDKHNAGLGAKYTKITTRRPVQLIHAEQYPTKSLAMQQEYAFKQLTRREKNQYLQTHPNILKDCS
ncbi:GIY-YIG nuclease family protein [Spiroplasma sp. DGKH1]|uniref:GIY-YIG nuclease family protein n=1 Tax=Spiroplasma sp. DGKH1 TaxID=3050074 RepID=UPI0034C621C8